MTTCETILEQVGALPPLPATTVRVMQVVSNPHSDMNHIVEAIQFDPGVTAELLKICNSAFTGLSRRISSVKDAVVLLGTAKVVQLVMGIHTHALLSKEQRGYGLPHGVLWRHSVAVALGAAIIAKRIGMEQPGQAFTAGLIHDIGKNVLNEFVAEEYQQILQLVEQERLGFVEAERRVLGTSHTEIGAEMAKKWQLPECLIRCIRYHHDPETVDPADPLVDAVYLANSMCLMLGIGLGNDGLATRADDAVLERHGLRLSDLEIIGLEIVADLRSVETAFKVPSECGTPALAAAS